jgi:hypothetical protein
LLKILKSIKFKSKILCTTEMTLKKKKHTAGHRWFTPVILATWEAEIRIVVGG